ncbi:MAG: sugar transferase [Deltaproteobacteria bacterium]|nr:sugar transferase [Deltaproteobacteria bacterium]
MDKPLYPTRENWINWSSPEEAQFKTEDLRTAAQAERVQLAGILTKEEFLKQLGFEKRRVDRSQAPLAIALFFLKGDLMGNLKKIREFLVHIKQSTRETDIKGWVTPKVLALLMPDTDASGAQRCLELLTQGRSLPFCSILTRSYPDQLFHEILDQNRGASGIFSLDPFEETVFNQAQLTFKRILDIFGAVVGLIIFSPIMLITAAAIKGTSPGPVIFRQVRLGKKGHHFTFLKFRSMVAGNNDQIHREYVANLIDGRLKQINQGEADKPLYKIKGDPRITPVGRIIRKLSLDELPQLINVLRGEMSLVGPRPPLPYEVAKYKSWHLRRILEVKPGITGLWQVEGRSQTSFDEMVRLDIRYVKNFSLWLDFKIIFKTIREVICPKGGF